MNFIILKVFCDKSFEQAENLAASGTELWILHD